MLYAGGGVLSARATEELTALAEALEVPVAHTLMGKGCLRDDHPLLLGQSGFWGTPIANEKCRTADLIVAIGTRLAEANSSSWDPRFTFAIPPTRLMHIDADLAEIGRNYQTELGVVADAQAGARGAGRGGATAVRTRDRGQLCAKRSRAGRREFAANWARSVELGSVSAAARAHPERAATSRSRGRVHRHRRGLEQERRRQQFPITVPGTFITPSGLATMGFGPAAALGVKLAQPHRHAIALVGDGGFSANPSVIATAMEAGSARSSGW